jgi:hypothetical protein
MDRGLLVIQVVSLSAFDIAATLPLHQISQDFGSFAPIGSRSASGARINFDGVLKTSNADQAATQHRAYVQLFRTGIVEAVTSTIISNSKGAPIIFNIDDQIIGEAFRKLNDLAAISVEPPYALLVSLIGVKDARFNLARGANATWYDNLGDTLDRDQYHFAEVIFELVPKTPDECAAIVRPILDQIANAGGAASSPTYDQQGNYISPRRQ